VEEVRKKACAFQIYCHRFAQATNDPRYGKTKYDRATSEANMHKAQRGFELMGKYWMNLWD